MLLSLVFVVAGLVILLIAGDVLVRGAVRAAASLGIPPLVIGLTIIAMGTSAPELIVGIKAVLSGAPTLALGNVVGSNIANILLVVGLPAAFLPVACSAPRLGRNYMIMLGGSLLLVALAIWPGKIALPQALLLLAGLAGFLYWSARRARSAKAPEIEGDNADLVATGGPLRTIVFLVVGLAGLPLGADLLVHGAVDIARTLEISEAVIGLTLVALGTSLPELATALTAAMRGHGDVAVGNVIGSNIFNIFGILGGAALFGTIPVPESFLEIDLPIMLASALLLAPFVRARSQVGRATGLVMVAAYLSYMAILAGTM